MWEVVNPVVFLVLDLLEIEERVELDRNTFFLFLF